MSFEHLDERIDSAIASMTDPISRSPSKGRVVSGAIRLHVDDCVALDTKSFTPRFFFYIF